MAGPVTGSARQPSLRRRPGFASPPRCSQWRSPAANAVSLVASCPVAAQFKKNEAAPLQDVTVLECGIVKSTDNDRNDLIYKINISLTLEKGELKEIWVSHTAVSGATYVRSDQYQEASIWQTPNREEWYWRGTRGPKSMIGEVWRNPAQEWWYSEKLFRNGGVLEYQMLARCHLTGPDRHQQQEQSMPDRLRHIQPQRHNGSRCLHLARRGQ
jgi:hypothetical protein